MQRSACASVLAVCFGIVSVATAQGPVTPQARESTVQELSSKLIYDELKARGIDPLQPSAPVAVRQAFVKYDFDTGGGANLETSAKSDAAKHRGGSAS
jgi:hypothetical protein